MAALGSFLTRGNKRSPSALTRSTEVPSEGAEAPSWFRGIWGRRGERMGEEQSSCVLPVPAVEPGNPKALLATHWPAGRQKLSSAFDPVSPMAGELLLSNSRPVFNFSQGVFCGEYSLCTQHQQMFNSSGSVLRTCTSHLKFQNQQHISTTSSTQETRRLRTSKALGTVHGRLRMEENTRTSIHSMWHNWHLLTTCYEAKRSSTTQKASGLWQCTDVPTRERRGTWTHFNNYKRSSAIQAAFQTESHHLSVHLTTNEIIPVLT